MTISSVALNTLNQAGAKFDAVARRIATGQEDTVDLSAEAVALMQSKTEIAVAIKMLKTADDLVNLTLKLPE
jgi:hypothetical protein